MQLDAPLREIAAGATHTLAVTVDDTVLAWGSNHHGQLGRAEYAYSTRPIHVPLPEAVSHVAAGMHYSLALGKSGTVYAWGWNGHGQLGSTDPADRRAPMEIGGLHHARAIAAGETHALALTDTGLVGWGNNAGGQLGPLERRTPRATPFFPTASPT